MKSVKVCSESGKFERDSLSMSNTLPLSLQMATMDSFLPFTLSASETALFQRLQNDALLPTLANPGVGELVELFKENKREEERTKMEPYADLLELELKAMLAERKDSILKQLRDSKDAFFYVELFSWKTVLYNESLSDYTRRLADQNSYSGFAQRNRSLYIQDMGWESMFGAETRYFSQWNPEEDESYWDHYPVKVDRIFRNSDLAERLSLTLGPNFLPSIRSTLVEGAGDESEFGYRVYKKSLYVRYHPFGVSKAQITKLLSVAKKQSDRTSEGQKLLRYAANTHGVGHEGLCVLPEPEDDYSDMPPLEGAPVVKHCFCGCAGDDSE